MQITLLKMRVKVFCEALLPASSFATTEILVVVSQDLCQTFLNADAQVLDAVKSPLRRSLIGNREHHRAHRTGSGLTKLCKHVKHELTQGGRSRSHSGSGFFWACLSGRCSQLSIPHPLDHGRRQILKRPTVHRHPDQRTTLKKSGVLAEQSR